MPTSLSTASIAFQTPPFAPRWTEIVPGVWWVRVGNPDELSLLSAVGQTPAYDGLRQLPDAGAFPFAEAEFAERVTSAKTVLRLPRAEGEELYGLGLDFRHLRRTQSVTALHSDAWDGHSGHTHAPVPLYLSSRGYGVLIDTARYLTVYAGTAVRHDAARPPQVWDRNRDAAQWQAVPDSDAVEVVIPGAHGVDVYVFGGPTMLDAVQRYTLFCGGGTLPPRWGLGFGYRAPTLASDQEVLNGADEWARRGFPLSMVGLEPGWQSHAYPCSLEWDGERFPDPAAFVGAMEARGLHLNLWFNPYLAPPSPLAQTLAPLCGSHTVWNGLVPDFSLPEAREEFGLHLTEHQVSLGPAFSGFKIDEVDGHDQWLWPDSAVFPSGNAPEQLRQTYGLLVQRTVYDVFRAQDRRTWGMARGTNAGSPPLPFVVYSDSYDFAEYRTALCSAALSGVLWCPEVRGARTANEWLRRMELVCWSPMALLNAWADKTAPWSFPAVEDAVRETMRRRVRLVPTLYTAWARYHREGIPPLRPLLLDNPYNPSADARSHDLSDQFFIGDALLVAPFAPDETTRTVVLPPGDWFDFETGDGVGSGPSEVTVSADLHSLAPVFVRDGGIVALGPVSATDPADLEIRHYGNLPASTLLYADDGETFAYEQGAGAWYRLTAHQNEIGAWSGTIEPDSGPSAEFPLPANLVWRFMGR